MYRRGTTLPCPACGEALSLLGDAPIHACAACGGAWLGPEAAGHVMRGRSDGTSDALVAATERVATTSSGSPCVPEGSARACPMCASALFPLTLAGVAVETCPAHGTWFDKDEVERVVTKTRDLREGEERKARGEDLPSAGDVASGVATIAIAAVKLPFAAIGALFEAAFTWNRCEVCGGKVRNDEVAGFYHHCKPRWR